jgi:hypothetical protein
MFDQLHTIGTTIAAIVTAAAFGELPLLCVLLHRFGARTAHH